MRSRPPSLVREGEARVDDICARRVKLREVKKSNRLLYNRKKNERMLNLVEGDREREKERKRQKKDACQ